MRGLEFSFSSAPAGSGVPTTGYFAAAQYPFAQTNGCSGTGGFYGTHISPYGWYVFTLGKVIKLPGTYVFNIIACGSAGNGTGFHLHYGGGTNDQINIITIAL
ncbi:hypothetical protein [Mucilaginibacter sp. SP1R1]|uniref:hypothetical protein n=1 Tax=Mucilaginibacter sp. SP1R1 TaxID=2723091 RepID=UPI0016100F28|nr:hypothetical protein [Mucilaginibacter sp. SP1R1]MBB6148275.1 hypothetical protein [Mucilaginibacter sp. SP1R1]